MPDLLIAGAGGHGKVVAEIAQAMNCWDSLAFLDDHLAVTSRVLTWPVIGRLDEAGKHIKKFPDIVVAVGNGSLRLEWLQRYAAQGFNTPTLIQPGAWVSPAANIGAGTVICPNVAINAAVNIGRGCIINTGATVDHDSILYDGVHICPGVHLGGEVTVGQLTWVGIGAAVIQQVKIGNNVTIGAGAAVISDVEDGLTVAGVPARVIHQNA